LFCVRQGGGGGWVNVSGLLLLERLKSQAKAGAGAQGELRGGGGKGQYALSVRGTFLKRKRNGAITIPMGRKRGSSGYLRTSVNSAQGDSGRGGTGRYIGTSLMLREKSWAFEKERRFRTCALWERGHLGEVYSPSTPWFVGGGGGDGFVNLLYPHPRNPTWGVESTNKKEEKR